MLRVTWKPGVSFKKLYRLMMSPCQVDFGQPYFPCTAGKQLELAAAVLNHSPKKWHSPTTNHCMKLQSQRVKCCVSTPDPSALTINGTPQPPRVSGSAGSWSRSSAPQQQVAANPTAVRLYTDWVGKATPLGPAVNPCLTQKGQTVWDEMPKCD